MLFNSIDFAVFLPIVFALYWLLQKRQVSYQNILLLLSSYYFYACWDWRFLFLLIFSTVLDYISGLKMETSNSQRERKMWFWASVIINLGFLGVFKYYNFFATSLAEAISVFGITLSPWTLNIILPVGISFYTFHGLSYVIDIYYQRIKAEKNVVDYAVFVSFFPLLVAGPIERATHLLPQIKTKRTFDYHKAVDGLRQILWGLFKKVVIADTCAEIANQIFNHHLEYSGLSLALGAVFFAFQIYGDFSGYSDIALGTARLFGIELLRNFAFPYFSRDIAEFWRRWHISLSSWFKDYLYIPLGGSQVKTAIKVRNTFIIFLVSGFWHGANWTFIVWGLINAIYFIPLLLSKSNRSNMEIVAKGNFYPSIKELFQMGLTFSLTVLAWIFFRSESLTQAFEIIFGIFKNPESYFTPGIYWKYRVVFLLILFFLLIEWLGREGQYALQNIKLRVNRPLRHLFYYLLILLLFWYSGKEEQFIYFQF